MSLLICTCLAPNPARVPISPEANSRSQGHSHLKIRSDDSTRHSARRRQTRGRTKKSPRADVLGSLEASLPPDSPEPEIRNRILGAGR